MCRANMTLNIRCIHVHDIWLCGTVHVCKCDVPLSHVYDKEIEILDGHHSSLFKRLIWKETWTLMQMWRASITCVWPVTFICTGRQRPLRCLKLQIIFHKRAINYRALLRKITYKDTASYASSPPYRIICEMRRVTNLWSTSYHTHVICGIVHMTHLWNTVIFHMWLMEYGIPHHSLICGTCPLWKRPCHLFVKYAMCAIRYITHLWSMQVVK